jgi:hypothetical protein
MSQPDPLTPAELRDIEERLKNMTYHDGPPFLDPYADIRALLASDAQLRAENQRLREAMQGTLSWLASYPGGGADSVYDLARRALAGEGHPND